MTRREYYGMVLRAIRKRRGLTPEIIGRKMEINPQTVYGYERGLYLPKAKNAETLFGILKVDQKIFEHAINNSTEEIAVAQSEIKFDEKGNIIQEKNHDVRNIREKVSPEVLADEILRDSDHPNYLSHPRSEVEIVQDMPGEYLPVISEAAAAECNPGMMPLLDCVNQYSDEKVFFTAGRKTDFAIKVSGTSMMPWYPPKTVLLVRPYQDIQNGKRVVAVLDDGEIVFKVFARTRDNRIALMSINDQDGRDYLFPANGKGIRYICRVIQSLRNEDELDEAMAEMGVHHHWEDKLDNLNEEKGE